MRRGFQFRALSAPLDRVGGGAWSVAQSAQDPAEPALGAGSLPDAFVSIRDAIAVAGARALGAALTTAIGWSLAAITTTTDGASHAIDVARRCSPQDTGGVHR